MQGCIPCKTGGGWGEIKGLKYNNMHQLRYPGGLGREEGALQILSASVPPALYSFVWLQQPTHFHLERWGDLGAGQS